MYIFIGRKKKYIYISRFINKNKAIREREKPGYTNKKDTSIYYIKVNIFEGG